VTSSLRASLFGLWLLIVVICVALAFLLTSIFRLGIGAQIGHVQGLVETAATLTAQRFTAYEASFPQTPSSFATDEHRRELTLILQLVLADFKEVEGGFWSARDGFLAYAYPSYGGGVPKKDVPQAEAARIADVASAALNSGRAQTHSFPSETETLILRAEPAGAGDVRLAVWTMSRAHVRAAAAYQKLTLGFGVLFVFALLSGVGVLWFLQSWTARVRALEDAIAATPPEELPPLRPTGERELDRIVNALNQLNVKLKTVRDESRALTEKLGRADRTVALGRMAAQIAHEIRNPIASMRLKAENALAKPLEQQSAVLRAMLDEIKRLDDLLERLLAVTRLGELRRAPVELKPWLQARIDNLREQAAQINIALSGDAPDAAWSFDEKSMSRALDNLLLNAVQHTPRGGWINANAEIRDGRCRIAVENSGAAIASDQREKIFEPFVSTRGDGAGLGLNIAREIAEAHGGSLRCVESKNGARFEIELPWPKS
jgi:signal transduction histidine kinase